MSTTTKQLSCEERVESRLQSRMEDIRELLEWMFGRDQEEYHPELGSSYEYGLSLDYVEPGTFEDQPEGYVRYQLSWGGPSSEFRYYISYDGTPYKIEYWFMDWFDGASRTLTGDDKETMMEWWHQMYFESALPERCPSRW